MEFKDYIKNAQRTSSTKAYSEKIEQGILGMCGELGEVLASRESSLQMDVEELGDVAWYLAEFAVGVYGSADAVRMSSRWASTHLEDLIIGAALIADHYKKYLYQGHEFDWDEMRQRISDMIRMFERMCERYGVPPSEVYERNIAKLRKRYPDGFEVERSVNREV